jgi:ferredoxin-NADP reductase
LVTPSAPLKWQAARVVATRQETPHVRTIVLDVPDWPGHRAGQHVDLRLTAADGYQAQRSYSIASAPETSKVELTIERLDDGEVSPYLADVVTDGDLIEVRGPIGGYFVWERRVQRPLALIAGGSGVVPLMAMLRHRAATPGDGSRSPALLLFSARSVEELIYREELDRLAARDARLRIAYTLTRAQPVDWRGYRRRIDRDMISENLAPLGDTPIVYVCGPTPMVESAANLLVSLGHAPNDILTERFGPSGTGGI